MKVSNKKGEHHFNLLIFLVVLAILVVSVGILTLDIGKSWIKSEAEEVRRNLSIFNNGTDTKITDENVLPPLIKGKIPQ